jgi:transcriptional regulator with XRE-family HTH domain
MPNPSSPLNVHAKNHLRAVREAQGLGLREAARRSGIDPAQLSRVERGESGLSVASLHALARVLGLRDLARLLAPYADGDQ